MAAAIPSAPTKARRPPEHVWMTRAAQMVLVAMIIVALWAALSTTVPHYVLPSPVRVLNALHRIIVNGDLFSNLLVTLGRVSAGFVLATLTGVPLGIFLGSSPRLGAYFEPILPVMNTVSSAIWAIFAIIWFGISDATTIFVVYMTSMPLIITNVWQGTRNVSAELVELARSLRLGRARILFRIHLPSILPFFFSGARLAFGFGWRVSLVAETLGSASGVGYRLRQAADLIQTDLVFAWTVTIVVMMATLELGLLRPLEDYLFRWRRDATL
jgi:NitT/TauT family transport system permease protein